jgi:prepilin-type N-terminal cleavage/methylation domain-containing protein
MWAKWGWIKRGISGRARRGEEGFTLAEVLISITILGVVAAAIAFAFVATAKDTVGVANRFSESHDAQIASAYLATDVQSSASVSGATCAVGESGVIGFQYSDGTLASYCYGGGVLKRSYTGSPSGTTILVHKGNGSPTRTCFNPGGCAVGSTPTKVTISIPENDSYTYALAGARRGFLNPNGSAISARGGLITLGSGQTVNVSGGTLSVNGQLIVNSNTGSPTIDGGSRITTSQGIRILQGGTCSGCSPAPTSFTPAIQDPFGSVLQCPSAGCPSGPNLGDVSKSGGSITPGVFHDLTIKGPVSFAPGVYVITDFLSFTSGTGNLTLNGVSFYFGCSAYPTPCASGTDGASFRFQQGNSETITLNPYTGGDFANSGIGLFLDRNNIGQVGCDKTSTGVTSGITVIKGALYAKSACVTLSGGGSIPGGVVAAQVVVTGGAMSVG